MQEKTIKEIIGLNLKRFRLRANMSQSELGEYIDRTGGHISNIEIGKNQLDAGDFYMVCIVLGITPAHLFPADNELPEEVIKLKKRMKFETAVREAERLSKEYQEKLKEVQELKKQIES